MSFLPDDALAIVGLACRLPGGISSLEDLWAVLSAGRDVVTEVPADRFPPEDFVDPVRRRNGRSYTAAGGFLDDITGFDASFFTGISPREASRMDPQQRLLLEMAVEALDDAGLDSTELEGSDTAVFIGCSSRDYGELQACVPESGNAYTVSGMAASIVANRLSHHFDWTGQSVTVDTACSSALTALHQACEHLRSGHSRMAVAGGINILINPQGFAAFSGASMLSPSGRCRAFSARADGFVRAEGGGLVLLKRLADARADGDRVHGVILASGTNNDGRTPGLALPSSTAQRELLRRVYDGAGLVADDVAYLEAHGTGTQVGDPLECEAIGQALGRWRHRGELPIGSVKSNVGHLEAASGMAGLLKALLVLKHRRIPATLHAEELNPAIDFAGLNVRPVTRGERLGHEGLPLAGVNSFGFGGANAHIVLAAPSPDVPGPALQTGRITAGCLPVVVSARTGEALRAAAEQMAQHLQFTEPEEFYDLAYTATVRRRRFEHRAAVMASTPIEAAEALLAVAVGENSDRAVTGVAGRPGKVAFVFSGNGSQWPGMGGDLLQEPAFRAGVQAVDRELRPLVGWSVLEELAAPAPRLELTEVAQPLLFAVQVGLVRLLASYGMEPDAVAGHSVGEIAAAYTSGSLDLRQACQVVAARSASQAVTAGTGRMAAAALTYEAALEELDPFDGRIEIAGINSDRDVTVAGDAQAIIELGRKLAAREVFFRELDLDYAFHSRAMDPIQQSVRQALTGLRPGGHRCAFASTVSGGLLDGRQLNTDYWWRNVREPVQFARAVQTLADEGCTQFLEIGPHTVLTGYLRRLLGAEAVVPGCRRDQDAAAAVRRAAARLIAAGAQPKGCFPQPGQVVSLPSYPFQRERCFNGQPDWWVTVPQDKTLVHPLLGRRAAVAEPTWHQSLSTARLSWVTDHQVDGSTVMPGTCYLEAALAAARHAFTTPCEVTDLDIVRPLALPREDDPAQLTVQTSLSVEDGIVAFASCTGSGSEWTLHARGRARRLLMSRPEALDVAAVRARLTGPVVEAGPHYAHARQAGLAYGPTFQVLTTLRLGNREVLAAYRLPHTQDHEDFEAHPVILDGALQASAPLLAAAAAGRMFLPVAIEAARVWDRLPETGLVHVRLRDLAGLDAVVDITVTLDDGSVIAQLTGCRLRGVSSGSHGTVQELVQELRAAGRPGPACSPSPLPAPQALVSATAARRAQLEAQHPDGYADFAPRVKAAVGHWGAAAFSKLLPGREEFGTDELLQAGVRPGHLPFTRLLTRLAHQAGLLSRVLPPDPAAGEERWRFTGVPRPDHQVQELAARFPQWISAITVYTRCGRHLTDVLTGRSDAKELLFTEADRHLVEAFYADTPQMRLHSRYARIVLSDILRAWPEGRPLRILEVGAGTGSFTQHLLPVLPAHLTSYVYSDISPAFFPRAKARFADYDFVTYRTVDLNTDLDEQDLTPGSFDLVVASNVLHATRDVHAALTRIAQLLAPGGHLMAVESHDEDILGPCFGLLEEFWSFTDTQVRSTPLLAREEWLPALRRCGFRDATSIGSSQAEADQDYSLILARRTPDSAPSGDAVPASDGDVEADWSVVSRTSHSEFAGHLVRALQSAGAAATLATTAADNSSRTSRPQHVVVVVSSAGHDGDDSAEAITRAAELIKTAAAQCTPAPDGRTALWLVTEPTGLFTGPDDRAGTSAVSAAVWGVGRVLANERPLLTVRRISLQAGGDPAADAHRVVRELLAPGPDDEIVLTTGGRFVPRVRACRPPARAARTNDHYRLRLDRPGRAPHLVWAPTDAPTPAPGEVVVRVRAAALNYRDVMLAQGLLPAGAEPSTGIPPQLGLECAGEVVAVGSDVTGLAAGDRVFAFGHGTLASHVTVRPEQTGRIPEPMTYTEAATLPAVYLTVQHSLETCARLKAGETVLVHGGAGGIGMAALRYAHHIGARVIATAGSPAKRDLLRTLGADHVLNSRSLSFAHDIHALTQGRGVDVVLNSLAGEAIGRSLDCLRPGGRFVELGKRDIYSNAPLLLRPFRNNLSYFAVDITRLIADSPQEAADALRTVTSRVTDGIYRPLPHQTYPAPEVRDAMAALGHSRHLGKVVITFTDSDPVAVERPSSLPVLDPAATYLISGGLSGLGAATARHLAAGGAQRLALIGRRGSASPETAALLDDLTRQGVDVSAHAADITDREAVARIFKDAYTAGRPVRGIVHAAMQLDDAPMEELDADRFRSVLAAKVRGADVLDDLSRDTDVDFFVAYSSVAGLIGNLHQGPYAAANLYLESLMRARRDAGLPGLALAWGGISDTGYVARTQMSDTIARSGIGLITPETALAALDRYLTASVTPTVAVGVADFERLTHILPALNAPRFAAQRPRVSGTSTTQAASDLRQRLATADDTGRLALIAEALTSLVADILQTSPDRVSTTADLGDLGLDSLMGAELKVQMQQTFRCELPLMELMAAATLNGVAERVDRLLRQNTRARPEHAVQSPTT
ncbi:SDR family NAD(P)-dependent oxidoreductase [Streptomyces sp. NPDC006368]|uniref:SDR family NAD(P)-dependent oxidoreductase n=1 Tax=Streptomyces sp. NPDC006368 TaxID=3156760 RepID=UPI0033AC341C